ncbi:LysE family translocator [Aequorivita vladivostokensis]|uniref:Lysine transporter LysE n=1 Tax=Aequorivita vladivostokensis TaxID=171194 RepID=A0ABR5DFK5_9FLAO|nr:LysE family translocator [Aequorivita vladivostokensis]MAB58602.1 LysE family translocator [Aequorivita sp.]HAB27608.1 LysE family translocator [Xanthomarina gelatinilytica]KJJ37569.1 lysine transporter LysE [Aequorivita vladivostokensis]MAO48646.1 LysE family translocator [Aequorivita sp.]MBF31715.1 LysE family translocator [Aequorivita sp.]|tara:strand:+ start:51211 stop:51825 length:615 start_codon:yes stop_codon:yes gene_type:complete
MLETLISFSIATLALAISPGPDNIYVLTQSLANGTKSGIATTAGLISGCIVHTTLLAFGISAIIMTSDEIFYGIKILGACYLLYLAYKVYKSDEHISIAENAPKKTYAQLFKTGVIMNLVNPKVMIFFLAFFPGFLWNEDGNTVLQFYILGITFMMVSFITFSSIALAAGKISSLISEWKSMGIVLKWLQIVVFVGIAIFILLP